MSQVTAGISPSQSDAQRRRRELLSRGLILFAAFLSFLLSVWLWFSGHEHQAIFVGIWVPSILSLGALLLARRGS